MSGQRSPSHLESLPANTASPSPRPESFRTNSNDSATPRPGKLYITRPDPRNATRRPIPSPLQASLTSSTSGEDLHSPALSSASLRSPSFAVPASSPSSPISPPGSAREAPRSPKERLDAFFAGGHEASVGSVTRAQGILQTRSTTQLRNVSAPVSSSQDFAAPSLPATMTTVSRPSRPDPRPISAPRNASIDSAVSAVSSNASHSMQSNGSHSYKSSQDTTASTPPDIHSMIAAAGSAESLIHNLIKDKQAAQARDSQLWRLVEKQRAMILGLNKDLDRAIKDKEKYRKRLKEQLAANGARSGSTADALSRRDGTPSSTLSDQSLVTVSSNQSRDTISGIHALHSGSSTLSSPSQNPDVQPAPLSLRHAAAVAEAQEEDSASSSPPKDTQHEKSHQEDVKLKNDSQGAKAPSKNADLKHSREDSYTPGQDVITTPKRDAFEEPPTVSLTQATPTLGAPPSPPTDRPTPVIKKGPPAPLDLSHPNRISNHLHRTSNDENGLDSGSEYDDILEVEELPIFEDRGRRKTREEDDQQREAVVAAEQGAHSQSTKLKKKTSKGSKPGKSQTGTKSPQTSGSDNPGNEPSDGQVSSPTVPKYAAIQPNQGSIAALLSPTSSEAPSQRSNVVSPLTSPGLPTSPRPGDRPLNSPTPRMPQRSIASPPTSPHPTNNTIPLSPRAPKQPIPMPPTSPLSSASPHLARAEQYQKQAEQTSIADRLNPDTPQETPELETQQLDFTETPGEQIFRGFMSANYPGLLISPSALSAINVRVYSSRLKPSRASFIAPKPEEDPVFTLAIYARSDGRQLWRVEKTILALPAFDQQIKSTSSFQENLPDRALFNGHAPAKIDARRSALNTYFDKLLETPFSEQAALNVCKFLSTDVIGVEEDDRRSTLLLDASSAATAPTALAPSTINGRARKDGYLTKRGKNFGGWKARYFVLDGPQLRYFEAPGGAHLGSIKLPGAQIGKQSSQQANQSPSSHDEDVDNQYRHAFLILEPKRKDSSSLVRHVLCAESDEERDSWVDALMTYVDYQDESHVSKHGKLQKGAKSPTFPKEQYSERPSSSRQHRQGSVSRPSNEFRGFHYEDAVAAEAPRMVGPKGTPSPPMHGESPELGTAPAARESHLAISGPRNGAKIDDASAWGNKSQAAKDKEPKKRSIFGFRQRVSSDFATLAANTQGQSNAQYNHVERQYNGPVRPVFGAPLAQAVYYCAPDNVDVNLPAVVYRCLEYLTERNAASEEGIFRLSGSNLVIKGLRERFNTEGDVRLLEGPYYDIHAVASLLKLYLRELPNSILTRELHLEFLKALDLDEKQKKVAACNVLVHRLPTANLELLKALSSYLLIITNNAEVNKMGVRNVGIVFAPTLNIPAPLISLFLTDHDYIFGDAIDEAQSPLKEVSVEPPSPDSIRSPRRQMFSDLPTPGYNTTSFPQDQYPVAAPAPLFTSHASDDPTSHSRSGSRTDTDAALGNTGFIPMQPSYSYDSANVHIQQNQHEGHTGYGSLNGALATAPPALQEKSAERMRAIEKRNRRESGMLMVNMMAAQKRESSAGRGQSSMSSLKRMAEGSTFFHE